MTIIIMLLVLIAILNFAQLYVMTDFLEESDSDEVM